MQKTQNPNIYNIFEAAKEHSKNEKFDLALKGFNECIKYKDLKKKKIFCLKK